MPASDARFPVSQADGRPKPAAQPSSAGPVRSLAADRYTLTALPIAHWANHSALSDVVNETAILTRIGVWRFALPGVLPRPWLSAGRRTCVVVRRGSGRGSC